MKPNVFMKVTSAVAFGGKICRPGELIEVTDSEARNLLHRGKAVLATEADGVPSHSSGEQAGEVHPDIAAFNADTEARAAEAAAEQAEVEAEAAADADAEVEIIVVDVEAEEAEAANTDVPTKPAAKTGGKKNK